MLATMISARVCYPLDAAPNERSQWPESRWRERFACAHLRRVVQRKHELPAKATKALFKFLEVFCYEIVPVELGPPVRRIEIEKRGWAIKPLEDFFVRQTLDLHPFQSLMSVFKERREFVEIESRRLDHVPVIVGMSHEARKGILEKIKVPRCPLNVGQGRRVGCLLKVKRSATHESEAEIPVKLFVMQLADAEEVRDLTVEVIQHFDGGGFFVEEHLCAACECLDVGRVLREYLNDQLCETVFPSYI